MISPLSVFPRDLALFVSAHFPNLPRVLQKVRSSREKPSLLAQNWERLCIYLLLEGGLAVFEALQMSVVGITEVSRRIA